MVLGGNIAADLNVTQLFAANINSNSQSVGVSCQNFLGILGVIINAGNGASGTALQFNFATSNDTNYSNSVAVNSSTGTTVPNFTNVGSQQVVGIDTRLLRKNLFINWLVSGSATANTFADATIVAQAKYKQP